MIRFINDPEHPLTLEQLNVVEEKNIEVNDVGSTLRVYFTPTIPHCSMATLIGLSIRVLLLRSLPARFKVIYLVEFSHIVLFRKIEIIEAWEKSFGNFEICKSLERNFFPFSSTDISSPFMKRF